MKIKNTKICSVCKQEKDLSEFHKLKSSSDGHVYKCKQCIKDYNETTREHRLKVKKEYRQTHKKEIKEYKKKYDATHPEIVKKCNKNNYWNHRKQRLKSHQEYYEENKEELLSNMKKYYQDNKEEIIERVKIYAEDNREQVLKTKRQYYHTHKDASKAWAKNNPERRRINQINSRERRKKDGRAKVSDALRHAKRKAKCADTDITRQWLLNLKNSTKTCPICGCQLVEDGRKKDGKHLDHIIPVGWGGENKMYNVRYICRQCNIVRPKDGSDVLGVYTGDISKHLMLFEHEFENLKNEIN